MADMRKNIVLSTRWMDVVDYVVEMCDIEYVKRGNEIQRK